MRSGWCRQKPTKTYLTAIYCWRTETFRERHHCRDKILPVAVLSGCGFKKILEKSVENSFSNKSAVLSYAMNFSWRKYREKKNGGYNINNPSCLSPNWHMLSSVVMTRLKQSCIMGNKQRNEAFSHYYIHVHVCVCLCVIANLIKLISVDCKSSKPYQDYLSW